MKRVLIITYYWPPSGGSGVQRWLKFTKYFRDFDIEPIIYTVKNPKYAIFDASLEKDIPKNIEVLKQRIWEPNNLFSIFGKKNNESAGFLNPNPTFFGKMKQYIRANYFIPDARKFWIQPSFTYLKTYIKNHKIDCVISTGPPHSCHLIGQKLKKELGIKWIADFRDPWTEIDYFYQLPLTNSSILKHKNLEQEVLRNADIVLVVGKTMKEKYSTFNSNVKIVTNGFDTTIDAKKLTLDSKFTITHLGMMNADRNPVFLWKVLAEISTENKFFAKDLLIQIIGKSDVSIHQEIAKYKLENNVSKIGYVNHDEAILFQQKSQALLLVVNNVPSAKGIVTGKIFEYLVSKRPILAIGPSDGDLAKILKETNAGFMIDFNDEQTLKKILLDLYSKFKANNLTVNSKNLAQYHRKELTKKVSEIIFEITT